MRTCVFTGWGRHLTTFHGEASPLSLTPYPFIHIFFYRKVIPFVILPLKMVPFSHAFIRTLCPFSILL